jgi:hypothetical protein
VNAIRHFLAQRHLAVLICAATLLLKLLVPTGYMIDSDHGRIAITICSGIAPATMATEMPCGFSGLSAAMTGAIDPIQLAALIAFVLAIGMTLIVLPTPARRIYLRLPLRGPPAFL